MPPLRLPADATNKPQIICLQFLLNFWNEGKISHHNIRRNSDESGGDELVNSTPWFGRSTEDKIFCVTKRELLFPSATDEMFSVVTLSTT